jgi:HEAT repeat protein
MISSQALIESLQHSDERAEASLSQFLDGPAVDVLLELTCHTDPDLRWWAVRGLSSLDDEKASMAVASALEDPDPTVRQCAALALGGRPQQDAIPALVRALGDRDRLTARLASQALASIGPDALAALAEAATSPDAAVRIEAVRALATMNSQEAIPMLFRALEDSSSLVSYWAERGLERLGVGMVFFPS